MRHECAYKIGIAIDPIQRYSCFERGMPVPIQKNIRLITCEKCVVCGRSRYMDKFDAMQLVVE